MTKRILSLILLILSLILLIIFSVNNVHGKDRCQEFMPDIRSAALKYLGPTYPYWYNVGCAITETSCRSNLISFDGGVGLFQFTPSTGVIKDIGRFEKFDINKSEGNINAQAFYIKRIKDAKFKLDKTNVYKHPIYPAKYVQYCGENLADVYRFYNGGYWFFYEASKKLKTPYVCDNTEMRKLCARGGTYTDKAKTNWIDFCDVNYSYPEKVYKYGKPYSNGLPDQMRFWYDNTHKTNTSTNTNNNSVNNFDEKHKVSNKNDTNNSIFNELNSIKLFAIN